MPIFFCKSGGQKKKFFLTVPSNGKFQDIPSKKWKKVRKTPLVEMTGGLQKESGFPTQIPVKQGEREADRGKVEQIVNKKL